jgi:hypothetical protein
LVSIARSSTINNLSERSEPSKTSKRRRIESESSDSSDDDTLVAIARRYTINNQPIQNDGELPSTSFASAPPKNRRQIESSDDDNDDPPIIMMTTINDELEIPLSPRSTPTQSDDDIYEDIESQITLHRINARSGRNAR